MPKRTRTKPCAQQLSSGCLQVFGNRSIRRRNNLASKKREFVDKSSANRSLLRQLGFCHLHRQHLAESRSKRAVCPQRC